MQPLAAPQTGATPAHALLRAARMSCIDPGVDVQRGSVEVKPAVPEPPAYLRQDMTVSVDIRVAARRNAVLVPTATHNEALAARCGRTIRVVDGRLGPGDAARRG